MRPEDLPGIDLLAQLQVARVAQHAPDGGDAIGGK
jgi:hypothetical protein